MKKHSLFLLSLFVFISLTELKAQKTGINIGEKAPEITLKNPDGKEISLSALNGQVVLIDFWASWCYPCRLENPNLVKAFYNFKDKEFINGKGFTIYSVSLDKDKESWKFAIEKDKLTWEHHVSDLKFWNSQAAEEYKIRSIPSNLLIDENGIIIAKNLRGRALHAKLQSLVKR